MAADLGEGQGQGVVAAEDDEFRIGLAHETRGLLDLTAGFLHTDDVRVLLAEAQGGLDGNLDAAAARDGIQDDRLRGGFGEQGEVTEETFLAGLVIIRGHEQEGVGAGFVGTLREVEGFGRGVGARAGHDRDAASGELDRLADDFDVLVVVEGGGLAGGADGDQAVDAVLDLEFDQLLQVIPGHRSIEEGGDQSRMGSHESAGAEGAARGVGTGRRHWAGCDPRTNRPLLKETNPKTPPSKPNPA